MSDVFTVPILLIGYALVEFRRNRRKCTKTAAAY
jgi:hypothetical protein